MTNLMDIAERIPPAVAQLAVVQAFAVVGSEPEWDSGTIERVLECLNIALPHMGATRDDLSGHGNVPSPYSQEDVAIAFWKALIS